MTLHRLRRKAYNLTHPPVGEIWMLHRVVEHRSTTPDQRRLEVGPAHLEALIADRRRRGYRFVPLGQWPAHGRWACITIDDGYHDTATTLLPLMQRLAAPFTVYITTGFIDNRVPMWWYPGERPGLTTAEVQQLAAEPLCTLGAHTATHPRLDTLDRAAQQREIAESKAHLEALTGQRIDHFSFPHGAYNADTLDICRLLGFRTVAQSWGGSIRRGQHPQVLPRIDIRKIPLE